MAFPKNSYGGDFGGLGATGDNPSSESTLIDCTPDLNNWFFAIGAFQYWGPDLGDVDTIPGPPEMAVTKVELYAAKSGKFTK